MKKKKTASGNRVLLALLSDMVNDVNKMNIFVI